MSCFFLILTSLLFSVRHCRSYLFDIFFDGTTPWLMKYSEPLRVWVQRQYGMGLSSLSGRMMLMMESTIPTISSHHLWPRKWSFRDLAVATQYLFLFEIDVRWSFGSTILIWQQFHREFACLSSCFSHSAPRANTLLDILSKPINQDRKRWSLPNTDFIWFSRASDHGCQ